MIPDHGLRERVDLLERQLRWMKLLGSLLLATVAVLTLASLKSRSPGDGILRARGLILEDEAGRGRILLGAPIPFVKNRVRTDPRRVAEIWGPRFPKEYLEYYKGYRHD